MKLIIPDPVINDREDLIKFMHNSKNYCFDPYEPGYTIKEQVLTQIRQPNIYPIYCAICNNLPVFYTVDPTVSREDHIYVCKNCFDKYYKEAL